MCVIRITFHYFLNILRIHKVILTQCVKVFTGILNGLLYHVMICIANQSRGTKNTNGPLDIEGNTQNAIIYKQFTYDM